MHSKSQSLPPLTLGVGYPPLQQKGVNKIEVKQNPHTGKCVFVYGCEIGAVSDKFLNGEVTNPVISQVCSPDTGDMFYMLHQRGEGGAMTLATL